MPTTAPSGNRTRSPRSSGARSPKHYRGKLQTVIEDMDLPNPVIRSHYGHGFIKQYVRDHLALRTEPATNNCHRLRCEKRRWKIYRNCARKCPRSPTTITTFSRTFSKPSSIAASCVSWPEPTVLANGKRIPGLKLDHPRLLAVMHALWFASRRSPAGSTFSTAEIHPHAVDALGCSADKYSLSSLRYDMSKLRAKRLMEEAAPTPAAIDSRRFTGIPSAWYS